MPDLPFRFGRTRLLAALLASMALAHVGAQAAAPATSPVQNSNLDAPLFYQLLIGEMELRSGEAGTAYQVMLDAARRTKDDQLFRRSVDIALQARAGDQALVAVKAWRQTLPESLDAHRYEIQLLVALNRSGETAEPMGSLLKVASPVDRPALIMTLPRFFARATDRAAAAAAIETAVQPYTAQPETRAFARATIGRGWLASGDTAKALDQAQRAYDLDPASEAPAVLALELLTGVAPAEAIVLGHLKAKPDSNGVRLLYVRTLAASQRYADANTQLETLTTAQPNLAQPWLTLGALQLELKHPAEATVALKKYVALVQAEGVAAKAKPAAAEAPAAAPADSDDDDAAPAGADAADSPDQALTQAWLLLSQAAEQQRDFPAAEAWLAKIDNPQRALDVQVRRASLLARQGKLAEARAMIQKLPEKTPADARGKLLAEAQLLRDAKQWQDAYTVLGQANEKFADDVDLL